MSTWCDRPDCDAMMPHEHSDGAPECPHGLPTTRKCPRCLIRARAHAHRFTVPVEWERDVKTIKHHPADGNPPFQRQIPQWRVTRLRCESCSEEVTRDPA